MNVRVGIQERGKPGMIVHRPSGSGDYVLVHFLEPTCLTPDHTATVPADTCILYTPVAPTYIRGGPNGIFNTYAHLSPDLLGDVLPRYTVPTNQPLSLAATDFVLPLLTSIQREWVQQEMYWEAAIHLHVEELLLRLARQCAEPPATVSRHAARLKAVRLRVHTTPQHPWTVAEMARLAGLGESQFSVVYRTLFGVSPLADLIAVRIERAKFYLVNYTVSVAEVVELSGFRDVAYFSRCFRRHVGCPPSQFACSDSPRRNVCESPGEVPTALLSE